MIPFYIMSVTLLYMGYVILKMGWLGEDKSIEIKLAAISAYFGIAAIMFVVLQMSIDMVIKHDHGEDISKYLYINNKFLILKESGLLDEEKLIELYKSNWEIYVQEKFNKNENSEISRMLDSYDNIMNDIRTDELKKKIRDNILGK